MKIINRHKCSFSAMRAVAFLHVVICMWCSLPSFAQSGYYLEDPKPFRGGVVAGLNLAQVDGDMYFGYSRPGFTGGVFVKLSLSPRVSLSTEILYSQKGSKGKAELESPYFGNYIAMCSIGLGYVEAPVTIQYKLPLLTLEAGASWSRLVHTREWIVADPPVAINDEANRFEENGFDYVFGVSRKISGHWVASVRYQYSIVPIRPLSRVPIGYSWGSKGQFNNLFGFRILYEL